MKSKILKIAAILGSLRKKSYNRALLVECAKMIKNRASVDICDILEIPVYNQDVEDNGIPGPVIELKKKIGAADGILFATPEYNFSVSGVLKNAIDWASMPSGKSSFTGKPAGIIGASIGMLGTARAQYHLRQICTGLNMHVMNKPEIFVTNVDKKFDDNGELIDNNTVKSLSAYLDQFLKWFWQLIHFPLRWMHIITSFPGVASQACLRSNKVQPDSFSCQGARHRRDLRSP